MIVSRTPYRISFFGGGTDYPNYYREYGGITLGTTINKYSYLNVRNLPPFFDYKHRIVYSKQENVQEINQIVHPSVREVFNFLNITKGISVHHDGDIPARSGMGSSSAFTVGLLHSLYALNKIEKTKDELMYEAIHIEQNMIHEKVGSQDQAFAAHGGFNSINFSRHGDITLTPLLLNKEREEKLEGNLMLFFSGLSRTASEIVTEQLDNTQKNIDKLSHLKSIVYEAIDILQSNCDLKEFGQLLNHTWETKKALSTKITNNTIDTMYEKAINSGATGGKLLGAGGGGFLLFYVEEKYQKNVKNALSEYLYIPFKFESEGSKIIINQPNYAG